MNETRIAFRCLELMEDLVREEYIAMKRMKERGQSTRFIEFRIARMEYALGKRAEKPTFSEFREDTWR